jgi:hypothetical protein
MERRVISMLACIAMFTLAAVRSEAQIVNGGFEAGPIGAGASSWTTFGNVFTVTNPNPAPDGAHSGTNSLKEFGTFPGVSGAFQQFTASPGQVWDLNGYIINASSDAMQATLGNTNFALLKISFQNAGGEILGIDSQHITASTPQDVWQFVDANGVAPAGTTFVQLFALFVQPSTLGGSAGYDDISATVVPEPSTVAMALTGLLGLVAFAKKRRV